MNDWCEIDDGDLRLFEPAEIAQWPGGAAHGRAGLWGMTVPGSETVIMVGNLGEFHRMLLGALAKVWYAGGIDLPKPCPGCGDPTGPCDYGPDACPANDPTCESYDCQSHEGCEGPHDPEVYDHSLAKEDARNGIAASSGPAVWGAIDALRDRIVRLETDVETVYGHTAAVFAAGRCPPPAEDADACTCGDGIGAGCIVHDDAIEGAP